MLNGLGSLFIIGVSGTRLTPEEKKAIQDERIGGIILFKNNYESPGQLAELINSIQALRDEYPLFISVDHEGGRVQRFQKGFTHFPSMREVAALNSPKIMFEVYQMMATELAAVGVNVNFAPVADVVTEASNDVIGDRSFGHEPDDVSKFVSAAVRGLQTNGVLPCVKHFPGHGHTIKDSHQDLVISKSTIDELINTDLPPFIRACKSRVPMVMASHVIYDCFDPEFPASLSSKVINYLREKLKFNRLIVTDDLQMNGVLKKFSPIEIPLYAIKAGCDQLVYRDFEQGISALRALKDAQKKKLIPNVSFETAIKRVNVIKKEYFSQYGPIYIPDVPKKMNTKIHEKYLLDLKQKISSL